MSLTPPASMALVGHGRQVQLDVRRHALAAGLALLGVEPRHQDADFLEERDVIPEGGHIGAAGADGVQPGELRGAWRNRSASVGSPSSTWLPGVAGSRRNSAAPSTASRYARGPFNARRARQS